MSYTSLQTDIAEWMHRADLGNVIPSFIKSAEAEFNLKLRVRQMEASFSETVLTDGAVALPSDFKAWKAVWTTTDQQNTLKATTNEFIRTQPNNASAPRYYALEGTNMICYPTAGSVAGIYYQKIPDLMTNENNWLETARPDLYLYESLRHACIFTQNAEKAREYAALSSFIIDQLISENNAEMISGGALTARVR